MFAQCSGRDAGGRPLTASGDTQTIASMKALLALAALAFAVGLAIWWRTGPATSPERAASTASGSGTSTIAEAAEPGAPAPDDRDAAAALPFAGLAADGQPSARAGATHRSEAHAVWPVMQGRRGARTAAAAATAEPSVPVRLAFRALWYLGTDPEAEKTWSRAINDPNMPEGVRSDLIVDMIDEGYTDNDHPTKADLPVIRARLDIIERYAPYAMDRVNAQAFEEAYRTLLELYIRLGGDPRNRRQAGR
jgi:hypothetical protein